MSLLVGKDVTEKASLFNSVVLLTSHGFTIEVDNDLHSDEIILYLDDDGIPDTLSDLHTTRFLLVESGEANAKV